MQCRHDAEWLSQQHGRRATICSVCTGAILLARAGGLDVLTSMAVDIMAQCIPKVLLKPGRILQPAGHEEPAFVRRRFKRKTGTTPARYRPRFRRVAAASVEPNQGA